jgi:hypothetical protein
MRRLPFRHTRRDLGVVLGELTKLSEDVLLGGTGGLGDERRGAEELSRRITSPLDLEQAANLAVFRDGQRDETDHPPGQHASKGQEVWAHGRKVRRARVRRKRECSRLHCAGATDR